MRLRDWAGTCATIVSAVLEHWLGETATVAALTVAVVVSGGILWRRVSVLMAAPQAGNCTKAYAVEARLVNYMQIMAAASTGVPSPNSTSTNGLSSPGITGTSGGASAGTAHTHSGGSYVVGSGQHSHDLDNHTHPVV